MSTTQAQWRTAREVRDHNAELDRAFEAVVTQIPSELLTVEVGDGEWTLAEQLAHVAEFPGYFARQLRQWLAGERVVIGRIAEADADRNDAVARAKDRGLDDLVAQARASFRELAGALDGLRDEHLSAPTQNVKYGEEPLTAFLNRYVVGHKAAHVEQLRATLERLQAR